MKRRFAVTGAHMSARCLDGSSRRYAASKAATRSFYWTNWTRSARFSRRSGGGVAGSARPGPNHTFTDHYLTCHSTFAGVFITTANWLEPIHPALRDRLEVIELPSYTESENCKSPNAISSRARSRSTASHGGM